MFRKRLAILVLLICLLVLTFPAVAYADVGPKPSVTVKFEGLENAEYYATLLSVTPSTEPHSASYRPNDISESEIPIWDKFEAYEDEDGYYFINYLKKVEGNSFHWGYYPPSTFKILIYIPQSDTFICSNILKSFRLHSVFDATADFTKITLGAINTHSMETQKSFTAFWMNLLSFAVRAVVTVIIEILVALAFGFTVKKQLTIILYANLITQILLNLALFAHTEGYWPFLFLYALLEIIIIGIEAAVYVKKLRPLSVKSPQNRAWFIIIYAIAANLISFGLGYWLTVLIPQIA